MKNIQKILVPTDFSNTAASAFRFAVWFADHHEAEIELLHTVVPNVEAMDAPYIAVNTIQHRLEAAQEVIQNFTEANHQSIKNRSFSDLGSGSNFSNFQSHLESCTY